MIENPIFIVGTERSGSNLLRLLLNELDSVCVPHPPHLMRDLSPLVASYGNLQDDIAFRQLIDAAVRLVELHFAPWPFAVDRERVFLTARSRDLYSIYAAIYEQYRLHERKPRWACKSTFMVHQIPTILLNHRSPQFIHLVRDPRDVAVSARRSIFSHYHPYYVARLWSAEQRLAREAQIGKSKWLTVRYESLIENPAQEMRRVCKFLGERYHDRLLEYFNKPAAQELSHLSRSWENVARPVISDNSRKYLRALTSHEVALIESLAHEEMTALGYTPSSKGHLPGPLMRMRYYLSEEWQSFKGETTALISDRNARLRLKKRAFLYSLRFR
jgi:hypothetical protein